MDSLADYNQFLPWENNPVEAIDAGPDDRSGSVYLHDPELRLAVEIAIVTQRPLLVLGQPGSGKSSFAPFAARNLNWRYYETTISGHTEAKDLLWKFDALARLRDAQANLDVDPHRYVTPGILWWAFNRTDAMKFIAQREELSQRMSNDYEPFAAINHQRDPFRAVVLIDEIDKADPELPNDLLEVFGLNRFKVDELDRPIEREAPEPDQSPNSPNHFGSLLIMITTNQERDLPTAFVRRCIVHTIREPEGEKEQIKRLREIAKLHMSSAIASNKAGEELIRKVAKKCYDLRVDAEQNLRRGPSTAEFLDALRVCFRLGIEPESTLWHQVEQNVFIKSQKD